jgi:hypothetical protein
MLASRVPEIEAPSEAPESPVTATDETDRGGAVREEAQRSWWRRMFGG